MTQQLATQNERGIATADPEQAATALAHILGTGDLSKLSNEQRVGYYLDVCSSLGLNPRTRPFDWIEFYDPETKGKKLALYPNRSCAEQLRRQHQISVRVVRREVVGDLFVVEAEGTTPNGRTGTASKYVSVVDRGGERLRGQQLGNAYMKAETGAQRRLTFSMVGMASPPDVDDLQRPRVVTVDGTGQIIEHPTPEQLALAADPGMASAIGEPTFETFGHASESPLSGTTSQAIRPEELERPRRGGPPATFTPSDEEISKWQATWFATVKGLSLDTDDARHRFVAAWTADEWPKAKRTDSLKTALMRMTAGEAGDFLAHVRALCNDERQALLAEVRESLDVADDEPKPARRRGKVADAVALTGGPSDDDAAF